MVNSDVVYQKIDIIEGNIDKINTLATLSETEFLKHFYYVESAKHLLQVSIEAMLDISHYIIARKRYGLPQTYADAFSILVKNNILPREKKYDFVQMAKFRNRVVHLYHDINDRDIYHIMQHCLSDFDIFIQAVANILE